MVLGWSLELLSRCPQVADEEFHYLCLTHFSVKRLPTEVVLSLSNALTLNIVPCIMTPNLKIIPLLLYNSNFNTVIKSNTVIWYTRYPIGDPFKGLLSLGVMTHRLRTTDLDALPYSLYHNVVTCSFKARGPISLLL